MSGVFLYMLVMYYDGELADAPIVQYSTYIECRDERDLLKKHVIEDVQVRCIGVEQDRIKI